MPPWLVPAASEASRRCTPWECAAVESSSGIAFISGTGSSRNRFAFVGGGWPYYDDCYTRVWTPWGWRWNYVCY